MIALRYNLEYDDIIAYQLAAGRNPAVGVVATLLFGLIGWRCIVGASWLFHSPWPWLAVFGVSGAVAAGIGVLLALFPFIPLFRLPMHPLLADVIAKPIELTINDEGLHVVTPRVDNLHRWRSVGSYSVTDRAVFITLKAGRGSHIVPRRVLGDGQESALLAMLRARLGEPVDARQMATAPPAAQAPSETMVSQHTPPTKPELSRPGDLR